MLKDTLSPHKARLSGHAELRVQRNVNASVVLTGGNVTNNERTEVRGISARVYDGGYWGFASSPDENAAGDVIDAANRNAKFLTSRLGTPEPALKPLPGGKLSSKAVENDAAQKVYMEFCREIDEYVKAKCPKITSRRVIARSDLTEKILVTGDGADVYVLMPRASVLAMFTAEAGDGSQVSLFDYLGGGAGCFADLFTAPERLFGKVDKLYETLMKKREGVYAEAGLREVVLDSALAGILAHEAIGHTTEADLVLSGSVAGPYLGKTVASELVTLVDFANEALGEPCMQPVFVDDEGTIAKDVTIIENGVLKGFMHSRESAAKLNAEPTGNARAYLFSDEPLIRMRNTAILPGKSKLEDMLASIEDGYYLTNTGNGQADLTSEFMFGINMGYEVKKGKIGCAIRDTTISGVAFELLKTVTALSDEMRWESGGMCGKKQMIAVGMGGPAVKCTVNMGGR